MSELPEFEPFQKIARLSRDCVVTEKVDGTNAQVLVLDDGRVLAGSRTKWLQPGKQTDNFGFAAWVTKHEEELRTGLGFGRHYGEWYGCGIQRAYGLKEKRFALFNTARWHEGGAKFAGRPACCGVVPVLFQGPFDTEMIWHQLDYLKEEGSRIAPGFMRPEGVVVFHTASSTLFKKTIEKDDEYKGKGGG